MVNDGQSSDLKDFSLLGSAVSKKSDQIISQSVDSSQFLQKKAILHPSVYANIPQTSGVLQKRANSQMQIAPQMTTLDASISRGSNISQIDRSAYNVSSTIDHSIKDLQPYQLDSTPISLMESPKKSKFAELLNRKNNRNKQIVIKQQQKSQKSQ